MLVLSRQRDETIMIGDDIEITVVDIRGDKVRLGITAPTRISVHRKEVYEAIKAENQKAAQINGHELPSLRENPAAKLRPRPGNLASSAKLRPGGGGSAGPSFPSAQQGGAQSA